MDRKTTLALARMLDKNREFESACKAENLKLKTQLQDLTISVEKLENRTLNTLSNLNKKLDKNEGKVDSIAEYLEYGFIKEGGISHYCNNPLVSYSSDNTCPLYPECA